MYWALTRLSEAVGRIVQKAYSFLLYFNFLFFISTQKWAQKAQNF